MKRRGTATEQDDPDEALVARGFPWIAGVGAVFTNRTQEFWRDSDTAASCEAAARILNRLSRPKAARKGKA